MVMDGEYVVDITRRYKKYEVYGVVASVIECRYVIVLS